MWQLYLVLSIIVLTNLASILYVILYTKGKWEWSFDLKSFGLESLEGILMFSFSLKPLTALIYALQNYECVVRFLPYSREHRIVPIVAYSTTISTIITFAFLSASYGYFNGFYFRVEIKKRDRWQEAFNKSNIALFSLLGIASFLSAILMALTVVKLKNLVTVLKIDHMALN